MATTAKALKTISKNSPFVISSSGNLNFNFVTRISAVAQSVKSRIKTFQTEFFYNKEFGVDWYGTILNDSTQSIEKEAALNDIVSDTNGVTSLTSSDLIQNKKNQTSYYIASIVSDGVQTDVVVPLNENA